MVFPPSKLLFLVSSTALGLALASCGGGGDGDAPVDLGPPNPAGRDARVKDVLDPKSPTSAKDQDEVKVSGVVVTAIDTYDETDNGKSRGTIYVQDMGSNDAFSGISLFAPTFVPGNLRVGVGDVLDLHGTFQRNQAIGTASFAPGATLDQISQPTATFRYEFRAPEPKEIDIHDLETYEKGRQWANMVVRVKNVTISDVVGAKNVKSGRLQNVNLTPPPPGAQNGCNAPFPKTPTLVNALSNIDTLEIPANTTLKSVTGLVVFFCNFQLAPRTLADIER